MLFQIDVAGGPPEDVFRGFWPGVESCDEIRPFAEGLVWGVVRARQELDGVVAGSAENWRLERMAVVDRNVLRMAVYEMLHEPDVPPVVAIDEAIEIARKFGGEESSAFVNGVLDSIRRRLERGEIARGEA
jgi:transcription antitermination protein NusB